MTSKICAPILLSNVINLIQMTRKTHPNKDIEDALQYVESKGWQAKESKGKSAHAWGQIYCPTRNDPCVNNGEWCNQCIWSTPRNPVNHANNLKRLVDRCLNQKAKEAK